jgi:hypothetical protein
VEVIVKPPFVAEPIVVVAGVIAPMVTDIVAVILPPILPLVAVANAAGEILRIFSVAWT